MQKDILELKADYERFLQNSPTKLAPVPAALREDVLAFVRAGRNAEVCRVVGIATSTVSSWKKQAEKSQDSKRSRKAPKLKDEVKTLSYSRTDLIAPRSAPHAALAEMEITIAGQKVRLRFLDSNCLAETLKTFLKGMVQS